MKQYRTDPLTDREKRFIRRSKGIVLPHSAAVGPKPDDKPRDRDYIAPRKAGYVAPRKRRGGSGSRMSPEKREMVRQRALEREAFFRSI